VTGRASHPRIFALRRIALERKRMRKGVLRTESRGEREERCWGSGLGWINGGLGEKLACVVHRHPGMAFRKKKKEVEGAPTNPIGSGRKRGKKDGWALGSPHWQGRLLGNDLRLHIVAVKRGEDGKKGRTISNL